MRLFTEGRPGLDNKSPESVAALKSCVEVMDPEIRKVAKLRKYNEKASQFLANEIHKFSQSFLDKVGKEVINGMKIKTFKVKTGENIALVFKN